MEPCRGGTWWHVLWGAACARVLLLLGSPCSWEWGLAGEPRALSWLPQPTRVCLLLCVVSR